MSGKIVFINYNLFWKKTTQKIDNSKSTYYYSALLPINLSILVQFSPTFTDDKFKLQLMNLK